MSTGGNTLKTAGWIIAIQSALLLALAGGIVLLVKERSARPTGSALLHATTLGSKSSLTASPLEVLDDVLASLPPETLVSPSEGYCYTKLFYRNAEVQVALNVAKSNTDRGVVTIGYNAVSRIPGLATTETLGGEMEIGSEQGLSVSRSGDTVVLSRGGLTRRLRMLPAESFQLPTAEQPDGYLFTAFDESGLQFHLVFRSQEKRFRWLLDERTAGAETWLKAGRMAFGIRTGFAFWETQDSERVLVGVSRTQVGENSWFDGPFDQLPDDVIDHSDRFSQALESALPELKGKVDRHGRYLGDSGSRVAISPYQMYGSMDGFAAEAESLAKSKGEAACLAALTSFLPVTKS